MFLGLALFAGVVKLVDALDSKSSLTSSGGGSIPPSGTRENPGIPTPYVKRVNHRGWPFFR